MQGLQVELDDHQGEMDKLCNIAKALAASSDDTQLQISVTQVNQRYQALQVACKVNMGLSVLFTDSAD